MPDTGQRSGADAMPFSRTELIAAATRAYDEPDRGSFESPDWLAAVSRSVTRAGLRS